MDIKKEKKIVKSLKRNDKKTLFFCPAIFSLSSFRLLDIIMWLISLAVSCFKQPYGENRIWPLKFRLNVIPQNQGLMHNVKRLLSVAHFKSMTYGNESLKIREPFVKSGASGIFQLIWFNKRAILKITKKKGTDSISKLFNQCTPSWASKQMLYYETNISWIFSFL